MRRIDEKAFSGLRVLPVYAIPAYIVRPHVPVAHRDRARRGLIRRREGLQRRTVRETDLADLFVVRNRHPYSVPVERQVERPHAEGHRPDRPSRRRVDLPERGVVDRQQVRPVELQPVPGRAVPGRGAVHVLRSDSAHRVTDVHGGEGDDDVMGGDGNDKLFGDAGDDTLTGWEGNDDLYGGEGVDQLHGYEGHDRLWGGSDNDYLNGGPGESDLCDGGTGYDVLKEWVGSEHGCEQIISIP